MKKLYIHLFDANALAPLSKIEIAEKPDETDGFSAYAVIESPEIDRVARLVSEATGWHDGIDGFSHSAQSVLVNTLNELRRHEDIPFVCKKKAGLGEKPCPVVEISQRMLDESL